MSEGFFYWVSYTGRVDQNRKESLWQVPLAEMLSFAFPPHILLQAALSVAIVVVNPWVATPLGVLY